MQKLVIHNSLTDKKESVNFTEQIKCYICGPTVYDHAHLGHARTYLTFDIIRRILEEYFGCPMCMVMNITDIDDKIINKVGKSEHVDLSKPNPYTDYARKFENEFFEDMKSLNIEMPTFTTRVTEYIDKIILYIDKIMENGYAYLVNGSVYFDSTKFIADGHNFMPLGRGCDEDDKISESEKKNPKDFALWKKMDVKEPHFNSKWGPGRVGWHIECTVMATDILGSFDIHAGGIDLKFPHHNNEIVQATAYNKSDEAWVKMFMHLGHLNIAGLKMSKSLKNFITIREFLQNYTANELRLLFLMHKWNKGLDYTIDSMKYVLETEKYIVNFFRSVTGLLREKKNSKVSLDYLKLYQKTCKLVREALCDDFNTPLAINHLLALMKGTYNYLEGDYHVSTVEKAVNYIRKILHIFGLKLEEEITASGEFNQAVELLVEFRDSIRIWAKDHSKKLDKKIMTELFTITDDVRDNGLSKLGIQLEDKGTKKTIWKRKETGVLI